MNSRERWIERRAAKRRALKEARTTDRKTMAIPDLIKALTEMVSGR